jgi:sialic acid synthase SpsE
MAIRFIADAGGNHGGDMNRVSDLIDTAKSIGCDAIKFQYYEADKLYAPGFDKQHQAAAQTALPHAFVPAIRTLCQIVGIEFHITPFHSADVEWLSGYVSAFKIASYSILDLKLIEACVRTGKPLGISMGGASNKEIDAAFCKAVECRPDSPEWLNFYHCIPEYPAKLYSGMMNNLQSPFLAGMIGEYDAYSDHTRSRMVVLAAIAAGARTIEFHLDLEDGVGAESKYGHCWTPAEAHNRIRYDIKRG